MEARTAQADTPTIANGAQLVTIARVAVPCPCGRHDTKVRVGGQPGHFGCLARRSAAPQSAPDESERDAAPEEVSMFQLLQDSIGSSRKHPVRRVSADARALEPWPFITETMRGEHRWRVDLPAGRSAKIFDRRGSYPAAMGNVPVAAPLLRHTGPIGYSTGHAGIYQIPRFEWANGPHPLGEIADQDSELWWISTPHFRLCMRLAAHKRLPEAPRIVDSYTAASVTNLFAQFSADVFALRKAAEGDPESYAEVKRKSSIAIRGLWPKTARSPFWRPDWSISVRAEAAVRHWVRADQAVTAGAELVKLGSVDEVAFLIPPRARSTWVPEPFKIGQGVGYVDAKGTQTATQWNRPRRGDR
jgi:hypothetical protein